MTDRIIIDPELVEAVSRDSLNVQRLLNLVTDAAHLGAENALSQIGLGEHLSADDVKELGDLLKGWREFKSGVLRELGRWVMRGLLIVLLIAGFKHIPDILIKP